MRRTLTLIALIASLALVGGCGDGTSDPAGNGIVAPPSADKAVYPYILDQMEYETFGGRLTPGVGCLLYGEMSTWPGGCTFAMNIPADAVPDDMGYPVDISMSIPTRESYLQYSDPDDPLPLIMRFEPSGIVFNAPVSIWATYMPWTYPQEDYDYILSTLPDQVESGLCTVWKDKKWIRVGFSLPHFSDWEVEGTVPPPNIP